MSASAKKEEYGARHLQVLEGLEAVRKRPGMYIGSTDHRGLMHCLWEIIDNAVDEALEGYCNQITVTLHPDHSVSVVDNGRGIPVDKVPSVGLSGVEVVFTKLHAGGKFGTGGYSSSGGLHGVGASVVNALSARLDVQVDRGGKTYQMCFRRGEPGSFDDSNGRTPNSAFEPFTKQSKLDEVGKVKRGVSGTRVRFWADFQIFPSSESFDWEELLDRARQTTFLVPGLTITCVDERPQTPLTESFRHDGGVVDFVDFLSQGEPVCDTIHIKGSQTYQETIQKLNRAGHLEPVEVERECLVECALAWNSGYDSVVESFVNIIITPEGGTHLMGFEAGLVKVLRSQIEENARALKVTAKDPKVEKEDIMTGLTAVVTVRIPEPQFEGQTKAKLGTPQVRTVVNQVVSQALTDFFTSTKRGMKQQQRAVMEKIVGEMRARVSARMHKEITRRKTALETSALPAKLADCRSDNVETSELFIVEGDSALGTAKKARSSDFQALLPIRGKILNVQKASTSTMLSNAECAAIIQVIGAGSGRSFNLDEARYGKVIMMTDADVDGSHIRTLLLTFFFRYMRPLVEAGRVYAAVPPLHRVELVASGKKPKEVIYTYSEEELHQLLAKLEKSGRRYKEPIQRYKGLGEMDADQLAETTMDPAHRQLRRIRIEDEAALMHAEEVFEVLMGKDSAPRRDFLFESANQVDRANLDT